MVARRYVTAIVVTALVAVAAGYLVPNWTQKRHSGCPPSAGVRNCAVLWGVATDPNTRQQLETVEQRLGRRFDMVYRFHGLSDPIPTADERALVKDGRTLHVSLDARTRESTARAITWRDIALGRHDAELVDQARGIASVGAPVFVTFDHEPDQSRRASSGSPAQFVQAWRHVRDVFSRAGVHNAVWVWVVTGDPSSIPIAAQMWPGNAYVDWISWEAYNPSGCRLGSIDPARFQSFAASVLPFYNWVKAQGHSLGIDTDKPMMISEAGSVVYLSDPARTSGWYRGIPAVLESHPQIRAIGLWDRPGNAACEYKFDQVPAVNAAISRVGLQAPIRRN